MATEETGNEGLDGIAVIGMSGRFPGARSVEELWQNLRAGVEGIVTFTEAELLEAGVSREELENPSYVRAGAPLHDVDRFDAGFFGFGPREAESLSPQHRLFLEVAWEALEHAGHDPGTYPGLIGMFAGSAYNSYLPLVLADPDLMNLVGMFQIVLSNDKDYVPTLASYKLNLRGPSVCVQTACSTSLVAVALACHSLVSGECDMVLAGGACVTADQRTGYVYQEGNILSPDGHCRTFDAAAQGTVGSNGVGVVVLKRLADALADGDHVHAVIRGAAINNDGSSKVGYTAPSVLGQAEVIAMAHALAGVEPDDISYIEAHGTGTPLGDPIEIAALTRVFRAKTARRQFCAIGSLKSNLGHLDAAAGVASIIKTVLSLEHGELPPSLNFERPNPKLCLESSPFYVNTRLTPWPRTPGAPRRAGVSGFGIGGTNAHVVLEEAPIRPPSRSSRPARRAQILTLSARSLAALEQAAAEMAAYLERHPDVPLADVAYTGHVGRRAFAFRRTVVGESAEELRAALESASSPRSSASSEAARERPVIFLFPGQGSQHPFMARELYETEPVFRRSLDQSADLLRGLLGLDLRAILYPADADDDVAQEAAEQALLRTEIAQPAIFAVGLALARLWMSWGVVPRAMLGHSVGEYVAACLSGVFREEDAIHLVAERGRLMQQMPPGAMLAVPLDEADLAPYLGEDLSLAAHNAPGLSVVAGPLPAIDALEGRLLAQDLACRRLHTSHAFHSRMMEPAVEAFTRCVAAVERRPPSIPFVSSLTGAWVTAANVADPTYWARQIVEPVRFAEGVKQLLSEQAWLWLEVGPGQTLSPLVRQQALRAEGQVIVGSLPPAKMTKTIGADQLALLQALGRVWISGGKVDWRAFHEGEGRLRVPLPTYPFERQRYWASPRYVSASAEAPSPSLLAKNPNVDDWLFVPSWRRTEPPVLLDAAEAPAERSTWLLFVGDERLGAALSAELSRLGHEVITATVGERFEKTGPHSFAIDPRAGDDYIALLDRLELEGRAPDRILHAFSVMPEAPLEQERAMGFDSLVFLAHAIGEQRTTKQMTLGALTTFALSVTGDETIEPGRAMVIGPCRVLPLEMPHVRCQHIDLELPVTEGERAKLAAWVIAELDRESSDMQVAYRGGFRWVETVEPTDLGRRSSGAAPRLRERGTYLITGGLGGIGLAAAELLVREAHARLILVGRTGLPERARWDEWIAARGAADPTSQKMLKTLELEAAGAEVMIAAADVSDLEAMRRVVAEGRARFGRIDGIIHSAGIPDGGLIQMRTPEMMSQVLAPKVRGTLVLDALFRDEQPDFFLLCSSLASRLTNAGRGDYCAANSFLDAYAHSRRGEEGCLVISVGWDTWNEVGMSVTTELPDDFEDLHRETLKRGITTSEGVEALRWILCGNLSHVEVCTSNLSALLEAQKRQREAAWRTSLGESAEPSPEQAIATSAARPKHARPALSRSYVAPQTEGERRVAALWQEVLGIEDLGAHDDFFELGGHSLMATRVLSRILQTLGVTLSLPRFFSAPTIAGLARMIESIKAEGGGPAAPSIPRVQREAHKVK